MSGFIRARTKRAVSLGREGFSGAHLHIGLEIESWIVDGVQLLSRIYIIDERNADAWISIAVNSGGKRSPVARKYGVPRLIH